MDAVYCVNGPRRDLVAQWLLWDVILSKGNQYLRRSSILNIDVEFK